MRKIVSLFILLTTLLISINTDFSRASASSMNGYEVTYSSPIYDPIEPYSVITLSGTVKIKEGASRNKLRIKYELYSIYRYEGNKSYSSGYASSSFNYSSPIEISFSFEVNDKVSDFARSGIRIKLGVYDTVNKNYVHYIERTLYSKKNQSIDINELIGDLVLDHGFTFGEEDTRETFNFSNYSEIVEIEYYHYLDLSSLSFIYTGYKAFSYKEAYITFKDEYDLFPYINEEDGYKKVILKANDQNGIITFNFFDLYVNPNSLSMSSSPKDNYLKTNNFYLPKNKLNKLQGLSLNINIVEMGVYSVSVNYIILVHFNSLLLGPCSISEYCIVGGVER